MSSAQHGIRGSVKRVVDVGTMGAIFDLTLRTGSNVIFAVYNVAKSETKTVPRSLTPQ